jgi:hypothetical protein
MTPQVYRSPALRLVNARFPATLTGVGRLGEKVPSPTWPKSFRPQQVAAPLEVIAQVWLLPAVTLANTRFVAALDGVRCLVYVPSPSCPAPFDPQQYAAPLEVRPQVW